MGSAETAWTADERGSLLASVGGGAHVRPLQPAEVGALLQRELDRGVSQETLAKSLFLDSTAMIGRFVRVARLPTEVAAAVGWGRSSTAINLTQAQEVARLSTAQEQRDLARLILEFKLSGMEVRGAVQICLRRGVRPEIGVEETVRLRPLIERRYVQIGRVTNAAVVERLLLMSADERADLLARALAQISMLVREASLRERGYALVLDEETAHRADADVTEEQLNKTFAELLGVG